MIELWFFFISVMLICIFKFFTKMHRHFFLDRIFNFINIKKYIASLIIWEYKKVQKNFYVMRSGSWRAHSPSFFLLNFSFPWFYSPLNDYGLYYIRPQGALFLLKNCKCVNWNKPSYFSLLNWDRLTFSKRTLILREQKAIITETTKGITVVIFKI